MQFTAIYNSILFDAAAFEMLRSKLWRGICPAFWKAYPKWCNKSSPLITLYIWQTVFGIFWIMWQIFHNLLSNSSTRLWYSLQIFTNEIFWRKYSKMYSTSLLVSDFCRRPAASKKKLNPFHEPQFLSDTYLI